MFWRKIKWQREIDCGDVGGGCDVTEGVRKGLAQKVAAGAESGMRYKL